MSAVSRTASPSIRRVVLGQAGPSRTIVSASSTSASNLTLLRFSHHPSDRSFTSLRREVSFNEFPPRSIEILPRFVAKRNASTPTAPPIPSTLQRHPPSTNPTTTTPDSTLPISDPNTPPDPSPRPEPEPTSAYARFKLLSKRYGWWAVAMYGFLSLIDLSLSFIVVHALGVERISPLFSPVLHQYRKIRHGEEETHRLEEEDQRHKEEKVRQEQVEREEREKRGEGGKEGTRRGFIGSRTMWAEFALAYAIHKTVLLPVRAGLTVAVTPRLVGWLTARGWVGKGGITRAATHAQGKIKVASERVRDAAKARREGPT